LPDSRTPTKRFNCQERRLQAESVGAILIFRFQIPCFADSMPFMLYNCDYWVTEEDFTLNDANLSGVVNVKTNERNGWGETSKTVKVRAA
jgi:hypothetical protein